MLTDFQLSILRRSRTRLVRLVLDGVDTTSHRPPAAFDYQPLGRRAKDKWWTNWWSFRAQIAPNLRTIGPGTISLNEQELVS